MPDVNTELEVQRLLAGCASKEAKKRYGSSFPRDLLILADIIRDPEEYEYFIHIVSKKFSVRTPSVASMKEYRREIIRRLGFSFANLIRWRVTVFTPDLKVGELLEIIRNGSWPEAFIYPAAKD